MEISTRRPLRRPRVAGIFACLAAHWPTRDLCAGTLPTNSRRPPLNPVLLTLLMNMALVMVMLLQMPPPTMVL